MALPKGFLTPHLVTNPHICVSSQVTVNICTNICRPTHFVTPIRSRPITAPYLEGELLIAMPAMGDPRFAKSVIYLCAHSEDGAIGLVINRLIDSLTFPELLSHLNISQPPTNTELPVHYGGPVESGRGFVLHSVDFVEDDTLVIEGNIGLTATLDIVKAIARGDGPARNLLALGYSGWEPGQLEAEIQENTWLNVAADDDLLFEGGVKDKWERALAKLGIDQTMLSGTAGRA